MMVIATLSTAVSASGSKVPDNPWPFALCVGILIVFLALVIAAAALANHHDDVREGRAKPWMGGSGDQPAGGA